MKECPKQFFLEISTKSIFSIKSKKKKFFKNSERSWNQNVPMTFLGGEPIMDIARCIGYHERADNTNSGCYNRSVVI